METDVRYWMEEFVELRRGRGLSEHTLRADRTRLRYLRLFMERIGLCDVRGLTPERIREFVDFMRTYRKRDGGELSVYARDYAFTELRVFLSFLARRRVLLFNPSAELPAIPDRRLVPRRVLTPVQVERVLALPDTDTPLGLRDRTILELLYSTGLRRQELAHLLTEHVIVNTGMVFVREGKGRRDRLVPAGERALGWVRRYLADSRPVLRARARAADGGRLFLNYRGEALSAHTFTIVAERYHRRAGVERGACHIFRHTAATLMLENGADVRYIQEYLGHGQLTTTQMYTKVSGKHLRETFHKSHPSAWSAEPAVRGSATPRAIRRTHTRPPAQPAVPEADGTRSPLDAALAKYQAHLRSRFSRSHARSVGCSLLCFGDWCLKRGHTHPAQITTEILESFQQDLTRQKERKTGRTISLGNQTYRMRAVRDFFRYLFARGRTLTDPSAALVLPRRSRYLPPEPLSLEEVNLLVSLPDVSRPYGLRDRALIELLFATGIRRQELVQLRVEDLDFERNMIRVRGIKNHGDRHLPAGERCFRWLSKYVEEVRPLFWVSYDPGSVFLTENGGGMSIGLPRLILQRYFRLAGIRKKSMLHVFRHTAATLMLENGADIRAVQEFLGHKAITSTQRYTHVSERMLKQVHTRTHPAERRSLEQLRSTDEEQQRRLT